MTCPHCLVAFHDDWKKTVVGSDKEFAYFVRSTVCPSCFRMVLAVDQAPATNPGLTYRTWLAYPKQASRAPLPAEVPDPYRQEYVEACNVLADSAKASAAVSRRCLQMVLRDVAKVKPSDLSKEIDEVLPKLPSHLAEAIDAIRNVGNMAAHPIKSTNTGEVVDVEPGEAEWLLDALEGLFDFYFVQPAILQKKRAALNQKLAEAKKPLMK
jgi:hypothetical protein